MHQKFLINNWLLNFWGPNKFQFISRYGNRMVCFLCQQIQYWDVIEPRVQYWEEYCTRSTNQIAEVLCVSTISNKGTSSFFISNKDGLSRILFLKRVCYVKAFGKGLAIKGLSYSSNCFSWPLSTSWQIQRNISRFSIISLEFWS